MELFLSPIKDLTTSTLPSFSSAPPVFGEIVMGLGATTPAFCHKFSGEHDTSKNKDRINTITFIKNNLLQRKNLVKVKVSTF